MTGSPMTLVLIRHGASEWSAQGRYQGHHPVALSELGQRQAQALSRELSAFLPCSLVSSDLRRTLQTAQVIADALRVEVLLERNLRELDCGDWSGLTEAEIAVSHAQQVADLRSGLDIARGGGECMRDVARRVEHALADWTAEHRSGTLLMVTHAYVIRTAASQLLKYPMDALPKLGSYSVLQREGGQWSLQGYSILPAGAPADSVQWQPTY